MDNMLTKLKVYSTEVDACKYVADKIQEKIESLGKENKMCVLGLATGGTPENIYKLLVERYKQGILSFKNVITFNLDEYYPISKDCKASYHTYMYTHLFNHIDILPENIHILNGEISEEDIDKECMLYEEKIKEVGGIDIQLLGIGRNGHIAFNEPYSSFDSVTRRITLDEQTIQSNRIYFYDQNPEFALTMGIHTIMNAKQIYLLGWGTKGEIINTCLLGVNPKYPGSVLINHPSCEFVIDTCASKYIDCIQDKNTKLRESNTILFGEGSKRIVIFSPHPDDDVIGMGGTFKKCLEYGHNIYVVYQTSGFCGVLNSYVDKMGYKEYTSQIKTDIRVDEARNACKQIGLHDMSHVIFMKLPFYEKSVSSTRTFTVEDVNITTKFLRDIKPDIVFCAGDFDDPHGTHKLCYDIIVESLNTKCKTFMYKGAWDEWGIDDVDLEVSFGEEIHKCKKEAILMHKSQLTKVAYKGEDDREFWERSEERTKHSYSLLATYGLGLSNEKDNKYAETFKEFVKMDLKCRQ